MSDDNGTIDKVNVSFMRFFSARQNARVQMADHAYLSTEMLVAEALGYARACWDFKAREGFPADSLSRHSSADFLFMYHYGMHAYQHAVTGRMRVSVHDAWREWATTGTILGTDYLADKP